MRQFAEILDGEVRVVFDWALPDNIVPEYAPPRIAADVTNHDPQPIRGWLYDPGTGTFCMPPPEG